MDKKTTSERLAPQINEAAPVCDQNSKAQTVVITGNPKMLILGDFGPEEQVLTCPYCRHFVTTRVKPNPSTTTHLFAVLLCMCCCWLCSCCPYIIDSCLDRNHYCSNCDAFLGVYRA